MPEQSNNGLVHVASPHSVPETQKRREAVLLAKGITIFARVDHSGEAAKAGFEMHPTQLLIFGSPKGGTPLMLAPPSVAIDLPLKALIWEDGDGKIWITYNSAEYLQQRHSFPSELVKNIAVVGALIRQAVE